MASDTSKNLGVYTTGAGNKGYASHVNAKDMVLLTNGSGGSVTTGDVLVLDTSADNSFTTTTTEGNTLPVYVVPQSITGDDSAATKTIVSTEAGWVYRAGAYVPAAAVDGAVSRGEYLETSSTAKKFTGTGSIAGTDEAPKGACAIALEAAGGAGNIAVELIATVSAEPLKVAVIADQKSAGTAGGTFTSGAWQTRDLNTEVSDANAIVSISANQFTPIAGTYLIRVVVPAYAVDTHKARLYNATGTSVVLTGTSEAASSGNLVAAHGFINGVFTANGTDAYEIQHQCQSTRATSGFGEAAGYSTVETYTTVELIKIG